MANSMLVPEPRPEHFISNVRQLLTASALTAFAA